MAERGFRNGLALALIFLGVGVALAALGGIAEAVLDATTGAYEGGLGMWAGVLGVAAMLLFLLLGLALSNSRPRRLSYEPPQVEWPTAARMVAIGRIFALVTLLIVAAVWLAGGAAPFAAGGLALAAVFGFLGTVLLMREDVNVRGTGAVFVLLAGALLLTGHLGFSAVQPDATTYGAVETFDLLVPFVLGPVALMIAAVAGLTYVYVTSLRARYGAWIVLDLAGLVYGVGLVLGAGSVLLRAPFGRLASGESAQPALLTGLIAGAMLMVVAGAAGILASLFGLGVLVRGARGEEPEGVRVYERHVHTEVHGEPPHAHTHVRERVA